MVFAAVASFASTAWAQGVIYSIQNGPWSSPSTWWGGTVPNCSYVVVKHAVTIDQNIGTNCGGSKWIRIEPGGVLTVNNSSPRTISFGSSGTNPIGSGNAYNPGADAKMFGFFVSGGVLDLEGAPGHWVTLTSANDWSPIYIHHQGSDRRLHHDGQQGLQRRNEIEWRRPEIPLRQCPAPGNEHAILRWDHVGYGVGHVPSPTHSIFNTASSPTFTKSSTTGIPRCRWL